MSFSLQLKLLVWKNYTLRKRQWGRLIVEIVWPLLLFLILFLVRLRGLKKYHHECHFEEKVMPSAGIIPFAQSFICTFNNTCHQNTWTQPGTLQEYNQSFFNGLVEDLEVALSNNFDSKEKVNSIGQVGADLLLLRELRNKLQADPQILSNNVPEVKLTSFLSDPDSFISDFSNFIDSKNVTIDSTDVIQLTQLRVIPANFHRDQVMGLLLQPRSIICDEKLANFMLINSTGVEDNLNRTLEAICSLDGSDWMEMLKIVQKYVQIDTFLDELNNSLDKTVGGKISFEDWTSFGQLGRNIGQDMLVTGSIIKIINDFQKIGNRFPSFLQISEDSTNQPNTTKNGTDEKPSDTALKMASQLFQLTCGRNFSGNPFSSGGAASRYDNLRDQIKEKDDYKYKYDNSTSKECNAFIESMERSVGIRFLWTNIKPFIRGKILYTPDTPATRKIVQKINETFEIFIGFKTLLKTWNENYLKTVKSMLLEEDNQELLKEIFTAEEGSFWSILENSQFGNESRENSVNVSEVRERFSSYFKGNFSEAWRKSLDSMELVSQNISQILDCFELSKFEAAQNEDELVNRGLELISSNKLWAGLVFTNIKDGDAEIPKFLNYKIRIDADKVDSTKRVEDRLSIRGPRRRPGIDLKYLYYGFAYIQDMVEHAFISLHTGRNMSSLPGISLQQMPYPCYIEDRFIIAIARTFPMFMTLAWVYSASMIIKSIVHEKEMRLKETMRVMGLGNAVHWFSWFIDSFAVMFLSCILLSIILVYGNILENSAPTLVFCFMLTYTISTIMLAFFLSTLFSRANIAAAAGGIIFFMLYLPYSFMVVWEEKLDPNAKVFSCLISNIAFGFGCSYFSHYEESGVGAHWDNIWTSPLDGDQLSLAGCMIMMIVDSLLYGVLMWYIEAVFPGQYGVPKPFYFFLTKSYWTGSSSSSNIALDSDSIHEMGIVGDANNESEPTHLPLGVSINHLHKIYSNGKVAVEDLNLNFYEGQITSFLGHNGAGKTTTISILTGLFPPSAGSASIYGLDIQRDMDAIRQSLGVCPQHNVLFEKLTVLEHLWFYSQLKGLNSMTKQDMMQENDQMINDLGIPHKRDEWSKNLSGGMQRKLSIACAFVGGSKVVVLDEPTAGVDPYSRRAIWDLLIKYKSERTIILTTHFMDEADLLGDRIAIINCGKLVCCGSSLYLKSRYGVGYYLTLVKQTKQQESKHEDQKGFDNVPNTSAEKKLSLSCSLNSIEEPEDEGISDISTKDYVINPSEFPMFPLTTFIQKHIPNARLVEEIGTDIVFILPTDESKDTAMKQFENLFNELDKNLKKLRISTYGLSDTTLEEIFLKVASNENDGEIIRNNLAQNGVLPSRVRSTSLYGLQRTLSKKNESNVGLTDSSDESGKKNVNVNVSGKKYAYIPNGTKDSEVPVEDIDDVVLTKHSNPNNPVVRVKDSQLFLKHVMALTVKRFHHSKRNKKGFVCEIVLPAFFVSLAMIFTLILPALVEEPELEISPWIYPTKGGENTVFFSVDNEDSYWARRYKDQLLSFHGFGTKCVSKDKDKCDRGYSPEFSMYPANISVNDDLNPSCKCSIGTQICPSDSFYPPPKKRQISSGDIMMDLTSRNVSQWLLKTRDDFYKKRYGGFEFGIKSPLADMDISYLEDVFTKLDKATNLGEERLNFIEKSVLFNRLGSEIRNVEKDRFDNIRVWFNNKGWAASVAYMNAVNNIVLRAGVQDLRKDEFELEWNDEVDEYNPADFGIQLVSHPMNYTDSQFDKELLRQVGKSLLHAICVIFAMSFVPASFVVFHIEERTSSVKHLHFVSGVSPRTYWFAALSWDMTLYCISALLCIIIFFVFGAEAYISEPNIFPLVLLMMLYGWSSVPLMYPFSYVFSIPSSAFVTLSCVNLFIGIITTVTTFVLENFDDEELKNIGNICKQVFLIFPHYCLGRGLIDMATESGLNAVIGQFGLESVRNRLDWDFLGKYMFWMMIQGLVFIILTLSIEYRVWTYIICRKNEDDKATENMENMDEDVLKERERVFSNSDMDVLQVKNICKRYRRNAKRAVDNLTFGVQKAECFGLLGVNGAGKTSTFKMLTGDTEVTDGEAFINGFSILSQMNQCRQSLGYCPQFDALDPLLTGREHLRLYARLRGLDETSVTRATNWGLKKLGLAAYADRCAGTYSGGNKRKLSTAIALIGNPSIVFLDEPTSGMDPGARRFLWNSILEMVRGGQSVVLTSHSMEECEALCSKLGIMVNGQFKCLGSIQHLKNRFGSGYSLTVRCQENNSDKVQKTLEDLLPHAQLQEEHYTQMKYQLPVQLTKLPLVFRYMEEMRQSNLIEDYSLTQTTLDEVFVQFASKQTELVHEEVEKPSFKKKILQKIKPNNTSPIQQSV